jgi:hypothetical protein
MELDALTWLNKCACLLICDERKLWLPSKKLLYAICVTYKYCIFNDPVPSVRNILGNMDGDSHLIWWGDVNILNKGPWTSRKPTSWGL